jgi:hypothetical protein
VAGQARTLGDASAFRIQPHVDQWIGSALIVDRRASGADKAQPFIKSDGPFVLLVNVGRDRWMKPERVCDQPPSNAHSVTRRVDKQRFHMRAREPHEPDRPIRLIDREPKFALGQKLLHLQVDGASIFGCKEVVRRIDCVAPDRHHAIAIGRPGRADTERSAGKRIGTVLHASLSQLYGRKSSHICERRAVGFPNPKRLWHDIISATR